MSVSTTTTEVEYTGTGAAPMPVPFPFFAEGDLEVTANGVAVGFSVTGDPRTASASVVLDSVLGSTQTILIRRAMDMLQPTTFGLQGTFSPKAHEAAFDRVVMQVQDEAVARDAAVAAETAARIAALASEASLRAAADLAESSARAAADAAIIAAGVPVALSGDSMVVLSGRPTTRSLAVHLEDVVNALDFGAVNTATYSQAYNAITAPYGTVTGLPSSDAIQAAIDYAVANGKKFVYLPTGIYRLDKPIYLHNSVTYGFNNVSLIGDGMRFTAGAAFGGTALIADFSTGQAIYMDGSRSSRVEKMTIIGRNYAFLVASGNLPGGAYANPDPGVVDNWTEPSLRGLTGYDDRYAQYAGIGVYPIHPAAVCSGFDFKELEIRGFAVGICVSGGGGTAQQDFMNVSNSIIAYNKWAFSVGSDQSRIMNFRETQITASYTAFTNSTHGARQGKIGGAVVNCQLSGIYQIMLSSASYSGYLGPMTFLNCYGEQIGRVGEFGSGAGGGTVQTFKFQACEFHFLDERSMVLPLHHVEAVTCAVIFDSCLLLTPWVFAYSGNVKFTDTDVQNSPWIDAYPASVSGAVLADDAWRLAYNGAAGIFPTGAWQYLSATAPPTRCAQFADVSSSQEPSAISYATGTNPTGSGYSTRAQPSPAWRTKDADIYGEHTGRILGALMDRRALNTAGHPISIVSQPDAITWELETDTWRVGTINEILVQPGDLAWDADTGARFRVVSVDGTKITIRLMGRFSQRGGVPTTSHAGWVGGTGYTAGTTVKRLNTSEYYYCILDIVAGSAESYLNPSTNPTNWTRTYPALLGGTLATAITFDPTPAAGGFVYFYCTRIYALGYPIVGDFTSGNPNVTNAHAPNGQLVTGPAVDDHLISNTYLQYVNGLRRPGFGSNVLPKVVAVTYAPPGASYTGGAIQLDTNANFTNAQVPINLWMRG